MSRDQIHDKIDELLGLISINNNRLSLHSEKLSQLDIDVLRKQCIELYDEINRLALMGRSAQTPIKSKPVKKEVVEVPPVKEEPVQVKQVVKEPVVEEAPAEEKPKPAPVLKEEPKKSKPKSNKQVEEEMLSLFEKFNSKPIDSIAKAISVAKRFEFQSNFFDGEAKDYKDFMAKLEAAGDRESAFEIYHDYKDRLKWDNEELKDELKALMYRKYH